MVEFLGSLINNFSFAKMNKQIHKSIAFINFIIEPIMTYILFF